jgi:DNA-directed RNA polymerase subunit RPC12/RpoP
MRKYIQERASVINTAGADAGKPFVVSAATADGSPKVETASFGCTHCGAEFASNAGSEPFCVNCGSEKVHPVKAAAQAVPETDAHLCAIACVACGTHNVLSDVTAGLLDGQVHCVECGSALTYDVDDLTDPLLDADEKDIEDALPTEEAKSNSAEDRGGMTDDSPITDASEQDIQDALPTEETELAGSDPENNQVLNAPENGEDEQTPTSPVVDPIVEKIDDDTMIEHAEWEQLPEDEQDSCEYSDVSLAAVMLTANPKAELSLAHAGEEIIAFADGVSIATLAKADAGEFASVFHSNSFPQAIARVAESKGLRAALAQYKFKPISVKFPVGASVRARVAAKLAEKANAVEERASTYQDDLKQCLSLAATALNKNFYKTQASALKRGFVDMLTTAGVKNAKVLVERVFASNGDAHTRQLFALAAELQGKSVEFRNELAGSLSDMSTLDMPNEDTEEVEIEHAKLSQHMESAALRRTEASRTQVTAGSHDSTIGSIRAAAGGKLF